MNSSRSGVNLRTFSSVTLNSLSGHVDGTSSEFFAESVLSKKTLILSFSASCSSGVKSATRL